MPRIFLSFRKADERLIRDRLYRALEQRFGADQVFRSEATIPPGADWDAILRGQAAACEIMLALIGPRWAGAADQNGYRPLDRSDDWVRTEIATALRAGNTVVPVLIGEATAPPVAADLPVEIKKLAERQFRRIGGSSVDADIDAIVKELIELQPALERTKQMAQTPADPNRRPAASVNVRSGSGKVGNVVTNTGSGNTAGGDYTDNSRKATTTHNSTRNTKKSGHPGLYFLGLLVVVALIVILAKAVPALLRDAKSGGLSATSTCQQFLNADDGTEQQAIVDIAESYGEGGFGSPLALPEIRYECSGEPSVTLGSVIQQDRGEF